MNRTASVVVLLAGIALVVSPLFLFPHAGERECVNRVERVSAGEVDEDAAVVHYENLSTDAKRAFEEARTSLDGIATVYGENCPARFPYTDYHGRVFVEKGGTYYSLTTYGGSFFPMELIWSAVFVGAGLLLAVAGGVSLLDREAVPAALLGTLGLLVLAVAVLNTGLTASNWWLYLLLVVVFGGAGVLLRPRWAVAVGFGGTTVALAGFELFDWYGPAVVLTLFPPALAAVGVATRKLAERGLGRPSGGDR